MEDVPDGVEEIQSRLRGLQGASVVAAATEAASAAIATASAQGSLPAVLQAIVDSGRDLLGARYAALGVIGYDGRLEQFLHSGIDPETVALIGALPEGRGILGMLISDPVPLRLGDLRTHPASTGFPPWHPQMGAFVGVPIQVGGEVFGGLYLTDPFDGGEFSKEDEALAAVMAVTAGGAIANARRLAESEQRMRWLTAATELTYRLLVGQTDPRRSITDPADRADAGADAADAAVAAADADLVILTVPESGGTIRVRAASGPLAAALEGMSWPAAGTLDDQVMRGGKPMLVDKYPTAALFGFDIGPTMVVPLATRDQARGAMSLSRAAHRPAFTPAELDMAATFANQATLAMELIEARTDQVRLALLERDVSDRIEAQAERERLENQLHQSQRLESLGQLAGGVAHDFNNLLGAIINYASFINEEIVNGVTGDTSPDWEAMQHDVEQLRRAADRAAGLTHQLLAFARREVVRPEVLVLNGLVSEIEVLLRRTIGEHVQLITTLNPALWPVLADRGQIEQVLVNLAVNARDAMPGGGTLTIQTDNFTVDEEYAATVPGSTLGPYVRLRVSDSGAGMSLDVLQRAFEPFFTTKPKGEGSGLGLATIYGIITQSGGHVQLHSEPDRGTTFSALLPVTDHDVGRPDDNADHYRPSVGGETVLLVEDEEGMRDVVERILTRNGYQVLTAPDGLTALDLVAHHSGPIDLVLTDVVMPHMLGNEVAERVRIARPDVRVLFMSGYAQPNLGTGGGLEPGAVLVEKPFTAPILLAKIGEVLDEPLRQRPT